MKKKNIFIISFILVIIDFIIKIIISSNISLGDKIAVIPKFFSIYYLRNTGAAFSILENSRILLIFISIIILYFFIKYILNNNCNKIESISSSLILGGLIGNLIDRIIYGYVIDYLAFNIFGYSFPVFNFADTMIVIGVIILLINYIIFDLREKKR